MGKAEGTEMWKGQKNYVGNRREEVKEMIPC